MTALYYCEPKFYAEGDVRGQICHMGGLQSAIRAIERDQRGCAGQGGYSDARLMVYLRRRPYSGHGPAYDGHTYGVRTVCDDTGRMILTYDNTMNYKCVIKAIGEAIAEGHTTYRPRLKCDDWKGWVVSGHALYQVSVRWPDAEEEPRMDSTHICDLLQ